MTQVTPKRWTSRPPSCAPMMMEMPDGSSQSPFCCAVELLAVLEEHRQHEAEAELAHRREHAGQQAVPVGAVAEVAELEQRVAVARAPS